MVHYDAALNALVLEGDNDTFVFEPQSDLTPAQLALALAPLLTGRAELVGALHPLIQRHFRRSERTPRDAPERMNVPMPDARMGSATAHPEGSRKLEELAAVTGAPLPPGIYVPIGVPFLDVGSHRFAVCVMALPEQEVK